MPNGTLKEFKYDTSDLEKELKTLLDTWDKIEKERKAAPEVHDNKKNIAKDSKPSVSTPTTTTTKGTLDPVVLNAKWKKVRYTGQDAYYLNVLIPGVDPANLSVTWIGDAIYVVGESTSEYRGKFTYKFKVVVDIELCKAAKGLTYHYENGVVDLFILVEDEFNKEKQYPVKRV